MNDSINEWVNNAHATEATQDAAVRSVKVIRKETRSRGQIIMAVADALRPHFNKMFEGVRDAEGMLAQPAHIRAFALNVAQGIVRDQELDSQATA